MKFKSKLIVGAISASLIFAAPLASSQLKSALDKGERAIKTSERIQAQINQANTEANDLVREYRDLLTRRDAARVYASQKQASVDGQREEIASIEDQLTRVDDIVEQAVPMMRDMIDDLERFIQADLPFDKENRLDVIASLRNIMVDAQYSEAERYRKIIEAYNNELEYGRTVKSWDEPVDVNGQEVVYQYFLYGRAALVRFNETVGAADRWSRSQGSWVEMPSSSIKDIKKAVRIEGKKASPAVMMATVEKFTANRGN